MTQATFPYASSETNSPKIAPDARKSDSSSSAKGLNDLVGSEKAKADGKGVRKVGGMKSNKGKNVAQIGSSRLLNELGKSLPVVFQPEYETFAENLSRKIDFAGSVKLSDAQGEVRMLDRRVDAGIAKPESSLEDKQAVLASCQEAFVRVRKGIVQSIKLSFEGHADTRNTLPELDKYVQLDDGEENPELESQELDSPNSELSDKAVKSLVGAFKKFYRLHQADISARVQGLKVHLREQISEVSPDLAKLVLMDVAMDDTLAQIQRQSTSQVSELVEMLLLGELTTQKGQSEDMFKAHSLTFKYEEIKSVLRTLLQSELELRLQSTLGLIEALNEQVVAN